MPVTSSVTGGTSRMIVITCVWGTELTSPTRIKNGFTEQVGLGYVAVKGTWGMWNVKFDRRLLCHHTPRYHHHRGSTKEDERDRNKTGELFQAMKTADWLEGLSPGP